MLGNTQELYILIITNIYNLCLQTKKLHQNYLKLQNNFSYSRKY